MLKVLIKEEEIHHIIKRLGKELTELYKDSELPPVFIGVLKGATMFMMDLIKEVDCPLQVDFVQYSSYESTQSSGIVYLKKDFEVDINGRDVVVVEDICDTGRTLQKFSEYLGTFSPKSVRFVCFLDKPGRREVEFNPDLIGLSIDNYFVIGYGFDYNEFYRNTKEVYAVNGDEDFLQEIDKIVAKTSKR